MAADSDQLPQAVLQGRPTHVYGISQCAFISDSPTLGQDVAGAVQGSVLMNRVQSLVNHQSGPKADTCVLIVS